MTMAPILPAPMTPSVLPVISTPMNFDFSHLPAWVEVSAAGSWRATANISAMACSAVVIEFPNGRIHDDDTAARGGRNIDIIDTDAGAADHLEVGSSRDQLLRHLGGGADGEAVIIADDLEQLFLILAELRLEIDFDAAIAEDLDGGFRQFVGYENARCHGGPPWKNGVSDDEQFQEKCGAVIRPELHESKQIIRDAGLRPLGGACAAVFGSPRSSSHCASQELKVQCFRLHRGSEKCPGKALKQIKTPSTGNPSVGGSG